MLVSPALAHWHNARVYRDQTGEVTRLLIDWGDGNEAALDSSPIIYHISENSRLHCAGRSITRCNPLRGS
jgi:hypothetical protein